MKVRAKRLEAKAAIEAELENISGFENRKWIAIKSYKRREQAQRNDVVSVHYKGQLADGTDLILLTSERSN